jgi:hypothetical protein
MSEKVYVKVIVYADGRTEGEYYLTSNPDVIIPFIPVFTSLGDGFKLQEMQPEAVNLMYDQCAYGL